MKTLIIFAALCLSGCATTIVKKWTVPPGGTEKFRADQQRCASYAAGTYRAVDRFDYCLQSAGYRLEVTQE